MLLRPVSSKHPHGRPVSQTMRGIRRAVGGRARVVLPVFVTVLTVEVMLPPLVLSAARKPWTYFTFNPWLKRLPEYLASPVPWTDKLDFLSGAAIFWFSADGAYGQPEWGFAVDASDVVRFVLTAALIAIYVALWLDRRAAALPAWRHAAGNSGGFVGGFAGVLGLSTGPCSVVGCGAPVLPVVGLVFAGLSSGTLAWLSQLSRVSAVLAIIALLIAIAWLGWQTGRRSDAPRAQRA
jgi:hypothetical protein